MKTLRILLAILLPMIIYGSQDIRIETNTISEIGINQNFDVNITLHKSDIEGFAKLEIIFPCNIEVNANEYSSALFVNKGKNVKFIWINLPKDKIINLSFSVKMLYYVDRKIDITSKFNYLKDNETKTIYSINNLLVIPDLFSNSAKSELTKEKIKMSTNETKRRILFDLNTNLNKKLVFNVQIAALKSNINDKILKDLIEDEFEVKEIYEDGYHKYYIGSFYSLEVATMYKDYSGIKGAFVTPIYDGHRITINDAKEIIKNKEVSETY
jgi:hypothetical protein